MSKKTDKTSNLVKILALTAFILVFVWLVFFEKNNTIELGVDDRIGDTPTQIESMRAIGEWEFLSVSNEELVDTVRKGLLSDDHLVRIYYGTLRLGINMHQARPHWLTVSGDTATAVLPKVGLLDKNFIDEARTKSFYESGSWQESDREALYKKAYRMMLQRCMTPTNLKAAEENAEAQFRKMLLALGYKNVIIKFER
ncbi:MAG: DUF4230 domain-containing protein [Prevotella sp.]|jgi:hypothetical protein|nr:DUF4230 domain-containing protein [Prevotella sp.]